ncbi:hypothetical protein AHAS_Ahas10G0088500 [Arachis hypogaea]
MEAPPLPSSSRPFAALWIILSSLLIIVNFGGYRHPNIRLHPQAISPATHDCRSLGTDFRWIMLGPSMLGRYETFANAVFPLRSVMVIETMANVGIFYFLSLVLLSLSVHFLFEGERELGEGGKGERWARKRGGGGERESGERGGKASSSAAVHESSLLGGIRSTALSSAVPFSDLSTGTAILFPVLLTFLLSPRSEFCHCCLVLERRCRCCPRVVVARWHQICCLKIRRSLLLLL